MYQCPNGGNVWEGTLKAGQEIVFESSIGTIMYGNIAKETKVWKI